MSVSLLEVIEAAGYDLSTSDDANWLLSTRQEYDELIEKAEAVIEKIEEEENEQAEREYRENFGDDEDDEDVSL